MDQARRSLGTPEEVAEYLSISVDSLAQMRYLGTGPTYISVGQKTVRYSWSDVDAWLASRRRTRTGEQQ